MKMFIHLLITSCTVFFSLDGGPSIFFEETLSNLNVPVCYHLDVENITDKHGEMIKRYIFESNIEKRKKQGNSNIEKRKSKFNCHDHVFGIFLKTVPTVKELEEKLIQFVKLTNLRPKYLRMARNVPKTIGEPGEHEMNHDFNKKHNKNIDNKNNKNIHDKNIDEKYLNKLSLQMTVPFDSEDVELPNFSDFLNAHLFKLINKNMVVSVALREKYRRSVSYLLNNEFNFLNNQFIVSGWEKNEPFTVEQMKKEIEWVAANGQSKTDKKIKPAIGSDTEESETDLDSESESSDTETGTESDTEDSESTESESEDKESKNSGSKNNESKNNESKNNESKNSGSKNTEYLQKIEQKKKNVQFKLDQPIRAQQNIIKKETIKNEHENIIKEKSIKNEHENIKKEESMKNEHENIIAYENIKEQESMKKEQENIKKDIEKSKKMLLLFLKKLDGNELNDSVFLKTQIKSKNDSMHKNEEKIEEENSLDEESTEHIVISEEDQSPDDQKICICSLPEDEKEELKEEKKEELKKENEIKSEENRQKVQERLQSAAASSAETVFCRWLCTMVVLFILF
ncbi:hypothetical protein M153_100020870 [Pseudoloma neurophilia]|uniref:Uncharacterized protein n=1 Tax=Pseudoloma neurophilia TaxID=146866 RepID=A0A0R0M1S7_9MICR|nr:hypothetical protein M153_100020870 [Pseudoloma neurophilia]